MQHTVLLIWRKHSTTEVCHQNYVLFCSDEENEWYKNHKTNTKKITTKTKRKTKRKPKKFVTSATTAVVAHHGQNFLSPCSATWLIAPTAIMNDAQEFFLQDFYDFILPSLR